MIEVERVNRKALDDFEPLVGQTFEVRIEERRLPIVLVEATGFSSPSALPRHAFSLLFRGPLDFFLDQRTYYLNQASLGDLEVFLVPVGRDERGFLYEAVFN